MSKGNEHAFPHFHYDTTGVIELKGGMTLRQYYAGLAMQSLLSAENDEPATVAQLMKAVGVASVMAADALIAALGDDKGER